jgi:DNA replication initiation complex subunit (GINS family)
MKLLNTPEVFCRNQTLKDSLTPEERIFIQDLVMARYLERKKQEDKEDGVSESRVCAPPRRV